MPEDQRCPQCGHDHWRSTPRTKDGCFHICSACGHMWREPGRVTAKKVRRTPSTRFAQWTQNQALARFLQIFPNGFQDKDYLRRERNWKWEKHEFWRDAVAPTGVGALAKSSPEKATRLVEQMLQTKAPMLHPTGEIVPMRDAVHRPELTADYFAALADLMAAPSLSAKVFDAYVGALTSLPLIGSGNLAKWTIVTFIPFLAQPSRHMFLKPGRTRKITTLLGVDILYSSTLKWDTYERLLDFSDDLLDFLKPSGARDMIDVQSFIWVVTSGDE